MKKLIDFLKLAKLRKTVYEFDPSKNISKKNLNYILEAARWAPSCGNLQPWRFVIVTNPANIKKLIDEAEHILFPFINPLPKILIVFVLRGNYLADADYESYQCAVHYSKHLSDVQLCLAMSVLSASFASTQKGIGSCILTPKITESSELIGAKNDDLAILYLGLGYEKKGAYQKKRERLELSELVSYEKMGERNEP